MSIGFPGSSARKESACNEGEPSLIPASGRFTGEGIGYPLQYSWASLVAQLVKNLPAIRDTWVRSPGEGNPPPGIHPPQDPRILPGRTVKKSQRRGDLNAAQVSTTKVSPSPDSFGPRARR